MVTYVLVINYCITNYQKLRSMKQHTDSHTLGIWAWLDQSELRILQDWNQGIAGLCSFWSSVSSFSCTQLLCRIQCFIAKRLSPPLLCRLLDRSYLQFFAMSPLGESHSSAAIVQGVIILSPFHILLVRSNVHILPTLKRRRLHKGMIH